MTYKYPIISALLLFISSFIYGQDLHADFSSNIQAGCGPMVVSYRDLSTGNPVTWNWDFGNGGTSTLQNPSTTYFNPGLHTVKLVVTNADGSTDSIIKQDYINVYDHPTANFTADKTYGCSPTPIQFKDSSIAANGTTNTTWFWDFGDGTQSNEPNPSHIFQTPGKFAVTIKVTSDKGCSNLMTKPYYVQVIPGVNVNFTSSDPATCHAPALVNLTSTSTGPGTLSYNWFFSDDNSNATSKNTTHTFNSDGSFPVTLAVTSSLGCSDTLTKNITIGAFKTDFIVPAICEQKKVGLIDSSSPRPIKQWWIFPDGTIDSSRRPSYIFSTGGTFNVKLINDFGSCKDSVTKTFTVSSKPAINFTSSDSGRCQPPLTLSFTNNSNGASYQWNFGDSTTSTDANPSHTYNSYGSFPVTLIATTDQGCTDTLIKPNFINIRKVSLSFPNLPQYGCIPFTVLPKAEVHSIDKIVSYKWDFGDGGTSTDEAPSYTYTQKGTYTITLTVTTSTGCTETYSLEKAIKVGTKPVANFSIDKTEVCAMEAVHFTDLSTPKDSVNQWLWQFSDGGTSTAHNPTYQFSDTGSINVSFIAYNNGCASDTLVKKNLVHVKGPIAKFEYKPNCDNIHEYTFTDKSLGAYTWEWDFGDGSPKVTTKNPGIHTYPPGYKTYNVSLTVTNPNGCNFTATRKISIIDRTPDFSTPSASGCKPFQTQLIPSSPDMGSIKQFIWDYGNGTKGSGNPGTPNYINTGLYNVTLTTVDSFGCKYTKARSNFIRVDGPSAKISSNNHLGCKGTTVTFADSSHSDGIHKIVNWQWNFGDSTSQTYTQPPFQHRYDSVGDFDVSLIVTDAAGCTDATIAPAFVRTTVLKASWDVNRQTCVSAGLTFTNTTTSEFPITSVWYFGNGDSVKNFSPKYAYKDTGYYTVKLIAKDEAGCVDSMTRDQYVYVGKPKADFNANNFASYCTPFEAQFSNNSYYYNTLFWDLGTGTSQQQAPINFYYATGSFPVKLIVTSPGGCQDSIIKKVNIYNPRDAKFTYTPIAGCRPVLTSFEAFSALNGRFIWDFRDGTVIDTTVNTIQHLYDVPGNYVPRIILREPSGSCVVPLNGKDVIRVYGAKVRFGIDKNLLCDSGYVNLVDSTISNGIASYNWNFSDGATSNTIGNFAHHYDKPGNYSILLTVTTEHNCVDSTRRGPIKIVQSPLISISGDSIICVNDRLRLYGVFDRQDTSAVNWAWNFPNGNQAFMQYPANQQYSVAGNFMVTTYAINSSGCADTAYKNIYVNPLPTVTLPPTLVKQVGYPITIPAIYSPNVASYSWIPSETLSCTDCPQPVATPKFSTKYTVSFIDSNGCRNTGEVKIIVTCPNANVFVPNTFSPNGDGSNDMFYVRGRGLERVKSLRIFNRWGEVVFEKKDFGVNDASAGWNGRYKNSPPQPDVYVYQLEVYCENGDVIRFDGNVALIL